MRALLVSAVLVSTVCSGSAFADGSWISPSHCDVAGNKLVRCVLPGLTSATNYLYSKYKDGNFHARFGVAYRYECTGHDIELGMFAGDAFVKFERGPGIKTASMEAFGSVSIGDRNPTFTKDLAIFKQDCVFDLLEVGVMPSTVTLQTLAQEAQSQAKILDYATTMFTLGASWASLSLWSTGELESMKAQLEDLIAMSDDASSFQLLLETVDNALKNKPLPANLGQSGNNLEQFKAFLKDKLLNELAAGQHLLDAYAEFSQDAPNALTAAVQNASGT